MSTPENFDHIIVGAGSAGCVLANRLSEDADATVLLLEFGGDDKSILIRMPTALSIPMNTERFAWQYHTEPEPGLDGRRMHCPRGKLLGGSSSINGMVYVRGHAHDFDEWAAHGARDWDYRHCLPYFKRADDWRGGDGDGDGDVDGDGDAYRGRGGPLTVTLGNRMANPLYRAFIAAGAEAGYMTPADYNAHLQEGFGPMQMTVKDGERCSAARAYLKPAMRRANLEVRTRALTRRVLLEGKKAIGVEYERGGKIMRAHAKREVILSAGVINSPQLLQLSGVGPAKVLKDAGVEVVHDLPGVGENLQDHLEFYFQFRCNKPLTLNAQLTWWRKALIGARWLVFKSGLGATNHFESCAFIRSKPGLAAPDIQYHFLPGAMRYDGRAAFDGHGFQVHVGHNKPASRGRVWIASPRPQDAPRIVFNYLTDAGDIEGFRQCVRLTRDIMAQPAFAEYRGAEIQPGESVQSDADIDAFVRALSESAYHPACTCRMGDDARAVVDADTRVRGIESLRVVDGSVFPTIPNGNLNAPTIMTAERAADLIKGRGTLPPDDAAVGLAEDWRRRQR